jgi:hypothetical protein
MNATLEILHKMVWEFRGKYGDRFATPDVRTSANFAMCEAGEALDAWIRANTGDAYNRASIRDRKIDEELLQCAMMIMTALGVGYKYDILLEERSVLDERSAIERICREVGMLPFLDEQELYFRELAEQSAMDALAYILAVVDGPIEALQRVLHNIYKKRVEPEMHK